MSLAWDKALPLADKLLKKFNGYVIEELDPKYKFDNLQFKWHNYCLLYTSPSPRDS